MNPIIKKSNKKAAFTIIELLTVMSIIVVLISLLVPALNMVNRYAKDVRQKTQFKGIDDMMVEFSKPTDVEGYGDYPPSDALDEVPTSYCGAMKLAEAMVGQDLLGFHPDSRFRSDLTNGAGTLLYYDPTIGNVLSDDNIKSRGGGPLLRLDGANAHRMWHVYGPGETGTFREDSFVLCDVYNRVMSFDDTPGAKRRIGMPILYYKANTTGTTHPHIDDSTGEWVGDWVGDEGRSTNIYDYMDNLELIGLDIPFEADGVHPMTTAPELFYDNERHDRIWNPQIAIQAGRPYRSDSYILLSAGFDGKYGTSDDVFNFIRRR